MAAAGTKLAHSGESGILFKSIYAGKCQICGAAAVSQREVCITNLPEG